MVSSNGSTPVEEERGTALETLRTKPENVHLFRGYGPLIVGVVLFLLMVTLAPTVAPEQLVEHPVEQPVETTTTEVVP